MENVNVIIADLFPLSRIGLIGLLRQLNYPFTIREVTFLKKKFVPQGPDQPGYLQCIIPSNFQILRFKHCFSRKTYLGYDP
jgi:hypothetical protein